MMFFFDKVQSSSSTKSFKAIVLLEIARMFEHVLVQGDDAPIKIAIALQHCALQLDRECHRGRDIFIDLNIDEVNRSGSISAYPISDTGIGTKPYFRMFYLRVTRTLTTPEAVALTKGGVK